MVEQQNLVPVGFKKLGHEEVLVITGCFGLRALIWEQA